MLCSRNDRPPATVGLLDNDANTPAVEDIHTAACCVDSHKLIMSDDSHKLIMSDAECNIP